MRHLSLEETADGSVVDTRALRDAFSRFATGVTVVTTEHNGKLEGLTANSFSSLSLDPPLLLWSLRNKAPSLESFLQSGKFAINVLGVDHRHLSHHFATPRPDKFGAVPFERGRAGCPTLPDALAIFECETDRIIDAGDHRLFIGRVRHVRFREGAPLIVTAGRYGTHAELPLNGG